MAISLLFTHESKQKRIKMHPGNFVQYLYGLTWNFIWHLRPIDKIYVFCVAYYSTHCIEWLYLPNISCPVLIFIRFSYIIPYALKIYLIKWMKMNFTRKVYRFWFKITYYVWFNMDNDHSVKISSYILTMISFIERV